MKRPVLRIGLGEWLQGIKLAIHFIEQASAVHANTLDAALMVIRSAQPAAGLYENAASAFGIHGNPKKRVELL